MIANEPSREDILGARAMSRAADTTLEWASRHPLRQSASAARAAKSPSPQILKSSANFAPSRLCAKRTAYVPAFQRAKAKWRRITSLTFENEFFADTDERRAGIARLVKKLKVCCQPVSRQVAETPRTQILESSADFAPSRLCARETISCTSSWLPDLSGWARVAHAGISIEALCENLGITRAKLTRLTKEYCGLSAGELVDGFRLEKLKPGLLAQLRAAARSLWGIPGDFAERLVTEPDENRSLLNAGMGGPAQRAGSRSDRKPPDRLSMSRRYSHPSGGFLWPAATRPGGSGHPSECDWKSLRGEAHDRAAQLLVRLKELRRCCADVSPLPLRERADVSASERGERGPEINPSPYPLPQGEGRTTADLTSLALSLGFESEARLKKSITTVFGKPLHAIERVLAAEIIEYYICAEEKVLRDIAARERESAIVCRARYLYSGDEDWRPTEPFLDQWSKMQEFKGGWLASMKEMFG